MKTLFISYNSALGPLIQSQGIPYLRGLADRGVKCTLLTFEKKHSSGFGKNREALKRELNERNISWYCLAYHKNFKFISGLFDISMGIIAGLYIVISRGIGIVHARATVPAVMAYVIARLTGKKFIFDLRGLMAEEYADGGMWKKNGLLYKITGYIERTLLSRADSVVVLTEDIKNFILDSDYVSSRAKINIIPCCVDTKRFKKGGLSTERLREKHGLSGKFVFLYIGSVGTWYLLEEMIDFFKVAQVIIKNAHFLILTHIDREMVKTTCKASGMPLDSVTIDGTDFLNIPDYIRLSDAGMFFIKPCFSKRSSCPIKFSEYLACGVPVIINSGIGDTDKIVRRYNVGVVIDKFEDKSYADAVKALLDIMRNKDELSSRCCKAAEDLFSLDTGISKYFDTYRRLNCH